MVTENVFENRFGFVDELIRLGADIRVDGNHAVINGGRALTGATCDAPTCVRARRWCWPGWSPRDAPSCATSRHIDRGYERFEDKLRALGADIERLGDAPRVGIVSRGATRRRFPAPAGRRKRPATLAASLGQARISRASYPPGGVR